MRLAPTKWQTQVAIFREAGFTEVRVANSNHVLMEREGCQRPVTIPKYKEVGLDIIRRNMRTANMTRKEYLSILSRL